VVGFLCNPLLVGLDDNLLYLRNIFVIFNKKNDAKTNKIKYRTV